MDIIMSQSLSCTKLPGGCSSATYQLPAIVHCKAAIVTCSPSSINCLRSCRRHGLSIRVRAKRTRGHGVVRASVAESTSGAGGVQDRWLFEPVGDGDSKHIGKQVKMPDAFEIVSNVVTVGRLPEKADMVIPVATVSALHARIQKRGGDLLISDLDSTNGTFIDTTRLRPGAIVSVPPGSCITFGDIHLAMFRVTKIEEAEAKTKTEDSDSKADANSPAEGSETSERLQ